MTSNAVPPPPSSRDEFHIAIICALPLEADGVESMFDKFWDDEGRDFGKAPEDPNAYTTGVLGGHNCVLVHMAQMGKVSAASSAVWVKASFTRIKLALVVGICGAAPISSVGEEIILGDIILSEALIQYDFGRQYPTTFQTKHTLDDQPGRAPLEVRALLNRLRTDRGRQRLQKKVVQYLSDPKLPVKYTRYPGANADVLFEPSYRHVHRARADCSICTENREICYQAAAATCDEIRCDLDRRLPRERLCHETPPGSQTHCPFIHIGRMASGDTVMKSAEHRDILSRREAVIAFEMEGIGVWDHFPSLVIKGASDYSDSHKNKAWQVYAAGTAAACAKAFLTEWISGAHPIRDDLLPIRLLQSSPYSPPSVSDSALVRSDSSVPANTSVPAGNVHWMLTRSVNTLFTGREGILEDIETAIRRSLNDTESTVQRRFVITGMGGQGKSELCLKVANSMRQFSYAIAEKAYIKIAKKLNQNAASLPEAVQLLAEVGHSWLLIIDNADDPAQDYDAYFPPGNRGIVLLTSRNPDCRTHQTTGFESLKGLPTKDGVRLLFNAANTPPEWREEFGPSAKNVCQLLGHHALALIAAGSYIGRGHCDLNQYPDIYQKQSTRLLRFHIQQAQSRYGHVYATFEASAQILEASGEETAKDALDMLCTLSMLGAGEMAMLGAVELPLIVFQAAWEGARKVYAFDDDNEDDVDGLSKWHTSLLPSFVQCESTEWDNYRVVEASHLLASLSLIIEHKLEHSTTVSMHPLAHRWAKGRQAEADQSRSWLSAGALIALASHSQDKFKHWHLPEKQLRPHLHAWLKQKETRSFSAEDQLRIARTFTTIAWRLHRMRDDSALKDLLIFMFKTFNLDPLVPKHPWLSLYDLKARALRNQGQTTEAIYILEHIKKMEETLPEDSPHRLHTLHTLALTYNQDGQAGKDGEAVKLLEEVVRIREASLEDNDSDLLNSQHALARAYQFIGQDRAAFAILENVVFRKANMLPEEHPHRRDSQHELAVMYFESGQIEKAIELMKKVVDVDARILSTDDPSRLASVWELERFERALRRERE
ncbi:hypothetical protein LTR84_005537 [Exophiala bonariae]|uniref:Nucleoside phosphorylase domain-containing protein n=1 Tax=Exophiala bonariae TaxID=1690606 RepID=A0AAV9N4A0_9EURO|nr:hypothetical protein LTR84_005537 [Exophiala bonariae]